MIRKYSGGLAFFLASLLLFSLIFYAFLPWSEVHPNQQAVQTKQRTLHYVALGDSLTEGVGDSTEQGGFVPLVSQSLTDDYDYKVTTENFGIAGNTSSQILKRMTSDKQLSQALAQADLLTLTVGGNDVMAVIRKNLSDLKLSSFDKAAQNYQKNLAAIIEQARQENSDLPIYLIGIYNPFYLNFPEITAMQDVIDKWNQASLDLLATYDNVYFVPINDRLYKGLDGQGTAVNSPSASQSAVINDALFEGDNFHPNNRGYQIMSNAIMEEMSESEKNWSHK